MLLAIVEKVEKYIAIIDLTMCSCFDILIFFCFVFDTEYGQNRECQLSGCSHTCKSIFYFVVMLITPNTILTESLSFSTKKYIKRVFKKNCYNRKVWFMKS